jgi:hypothetical protein
MSTSGRRKSSPGALAGPLWVSAVAVQAVLQRGMPTGCSGSEQALAWFSENRKRFLAGQVVGGLGFALCYLPFLGHAIERSQRSPASPSWGYAALAAGILSPAAGTAGGMMTTALARGAHAEEPIQVTTMLRAADYAFHTSGVVLGVVPAFVSIPRPAGGRAGLWQRGIAVATAASAIAGAAGQLDSSCSDRLTAVGALVWPGVLAWVLGESRVLGTE